MSNSDFDLIVVGGGLSGLAAAFYWCSQVDAKARILIIEASSRIGGASVDHNFNVNGHKLSAPGGAQEITFPESFSPVVRSTFSTIGIDIDDLLQKTDFTHYGRNGAKNHGFCFSADQWDRDGLAIWDPEVGIDLSKAPLCEEAKLQLSSIFNGETSWFDGLDETAKPEAELKEASWRSVRPISSYALLRARLVSIFGKGYHQVWIFFPDHRS